METPLHLDRMAFHLQTDRSLRTGRSRFGRQLVRDVVTSRPLAAVFRDLLYGQHSIAKEDSFVYGTRMGLETPSTPVPRTASLLTIGAPCRDYAQAGNNKRGRK